MSRQPELGRILRDLANLCDRADPVPCERRMTEAEKALCDFAAGPEPRDSWRTPWSRDGVVYRAKDLALLMEGVRDERRKAPAPCAEAAKPVENCPRCCGDSFECGGHITGRCRREPDPDPAEQRCGCEESQWWRSRVSHALKHLERGYVYDGLLLLREAMKQDGPAPRAKP